MSVVIYGQRLGGKVDRVPGLFYVGTMFFHVDYIPLFPLRSFIVFEGTEQGEGFRGKPIPFRWKSAIAGLLRGWLGMATIFPAAVACFALGGMLFDRSPAGFAGTLGVTAAVLGAFFFVLLSSWRGIYLVLAALIAASVAVWYGCATAMRADPAFALAKGHEVAYLPALLIADAAAFLFTLTRLLTPASYERALALADELEFPREAIDAIYHVDPLAADARDPFAAPSWTSGAKPSDAPEFG